MTVQNNPPSDPREAVPATATRIPTRCDAVDVLVQEYFAKAVWGRAPGRPEPFSSGRPRPVSFCA
jgi:hypothetical protein